VYREGQLVASSAPGRWREYHLDHLGSPRLVTGPIGLKEAEYHPFPFGEMAAESGPAMEAREGLFRYTGHQRDTNCEGCAEEAQDDLDYMLARFYSPAVGRFLGVDPIQSGRPQHPQAWSKYGYALNNPLRKVDPDGRQDVDSVEPPVQFVTPDRFVEDFVGFVSRFKSREVLISSETLDASLESLENAARIATIARALLPRDASQALEEIESGEDRPNVRNPREFANDGRGGTATLPKIDEKGNSITYQEHAVNPRPPAGSLDKKRIMTGSDGSTYYTNDHYVSFKRVVENAEPIEPK